MTTLEQLIIHKDRFDYILIETTGLANPGPVVSALWTDDHLGNMLCLDGVVCVVDSVNFEMYLNTEDLSADVKTQLCFADRILLNKSDLISPEQVRGIEAIDAEFVVIYMYVILKLVCLFFPALMHRQMDAVKQTVQTINSYAQIQTSTYSNVNLDFVLNTNSYTTDKSTNATSVAEFNFLQCIPCEPDLKESDNKRRLFSMLEDSASKAPHNISEMKTHYLKIEGRFHVKKLECLLDALLYSGSSGNTATSHTQSGSNYTTAPLRTAVLENKDSVVATAPTKDSISVTTTAATTAATTTVTTASTTDPHQMNIFRMKGIVRTAESEVLYVLQAVHNIFDLQPSPYSIGSEGDLTNGANVIVVIGKNLNMEYIEEEFRRCLVED